MAKPMIGAEEMERRRDALRQAYASNRIEGVFRGEIKVEVDLN